MNTQTCSRHSLIAIVLLGLACIALVCALVVPWIREGLAWRIDGLIGGTDEAQLRFERDMTQLYLRGDPLIPHGAVLVIGDSHLQGVPMSAEGGMTVDRSIGGITTGGAVSLVKSLGAARRARSVVLAIGNNDVLRGVSVESLSSNYRLMLDALPREVGRVCAGVLPASSQYNDVEVRRKANAAILSVCEGSGGRFVDPFAVLSNKDGFLVRDYDSGDGIHLSAAGYQRWLPVLLGLAPYSK